MRVDLVHTTVLAVAIAGFSTAAVARTTQRTGLNFGTSVRSIDANERTTPADGSTINSQVTTTGQGVDPYIGYAFTSFNLGLVYSSDDSTSETNEVTTDGLTSVNHKTAQSTQGLSFFTRFLFANYFFFEGGFGLYKETQKIHIETRQVQSGGAFVGTSDDSSFTGMGPGYHAGGGLELPISGGFYFTTAYQVRMVQLRDHVDSNSFGRKRSVTQKNEVLFGVAYYDGK